MTYSVAVYTNPEPESQGCGLSLKLWVESAIRCDCDLAHERLFLIARHAYHYHRNRLLKVTD